MRGIISVGILMSPVGHYERPYRWFVWSKLLTYFMIKMGDLLCVIKMADLLCVIKMADLPQTPPRILSLSSSAP